jgi:replicative DNA helicase
MANGDKPLPHDINAEEAVNGSLLIDGRAIYEIAIRVSPSDFYNEANRWIYQACMSLYERGDAIDQITVAQELDRQDRLEAAGGASYLSHLISVVPTSLDIEHYAQIVYRLSVMRQLIQAAARIQDIGYRADPDVNESLGKAEEALYKLRDSGSSADFVHIKHVVSRYFEPGEDGAGLNERKPVLTRFTGLDEFLDGLQPSDLIVLAGRPSMGKTALALNIARNAAVEQNSCVALFSLEMSRDQLAERMLASESGVNLSHLRSFRRSGFEQLSESDERKLMGSIAVLAEAPIFIDDSPLARVAEIRSKARRLHYEQGVNLIVIDYLQLMQGEGRTENRVQEISYITRSLKALAREIGAPVLALSQLSRAVEGRLIHRPQLSDLRESGSIEQDADVVAFIYRDDYYTTEEDWMLQYPEREYPRGIAQVIIAKHRNGPTGDVSLRFVPHLAKFENLRAEEASLL